MQATTAAPGLEQAATALTPPQTITIPALAEGEHYAGIVIVDGRLSHHLILLPGEQSSITWAKAGEWAKSIGGELPTRPEQSLLFANAAQQFQRDWYWSSEQCAGFDAYAWIQDFDYGNQDSNHKSNYHRARAVRRVSI